MGRPDWWEPWIPRYDSAGHDLDVGITRSWVHCDCPASGEAHGHDLVYCRVNGCRADPARPPGCDRTLEQR